jgi:hypothetical protein
MASRNWQITSAQISELVGYSPIPIESIFSEIRRKFAKLDMKGRKQILDRVAEIVKWRNQ